MRIVSLHPATTDLVHQFGAAGKLVGISSRCSIPDGAALRPLVVTEASTSAAGADAVLRDSLSFEPVDLAALKEAAPTLVLTVTGENVILPGEPREPGTVTSDDLGQRLRSYLGDPAVKLVAIRPRTLEGILESYNAVGEAIGKAPIARDRSQRLKAQLMDWADNFYDRTKNKRVTFLAGLNPFTLGGFWLPDLIGLCSAVSQQRAAGTPHEETNWQQIVKFHPDVVIVAPEGSGLKQSMSSFKELAKLPDWERVPAVVRGEVIFTDGSPHFYSFTSGLIESMAILVSAIAGFESGYIAPRDSFYRLRWLELHRHRL